MILIAVILIPVVSIYGSDLISKLIFRMWPTVFGTTLISDDEQLKRYGVMFVVWFILLSICFKILIILS